MISNIIFEKTLPNHQMPENDLRDHLLDKLAILFNNSGGNIYHFNLPRKTSTAEIVGVNL
jgi:hypothetical protein